MRKRSHQLPLAVSAAVLISLIAVMAVVNLVYMRRLYEGRVVQLPAEVAVVTHGRALVQELAARDVVQDSVVDTDQWQEFGRYVDTLYEVDDSLQFVSLQQGNEVLFERQRTALAGGAQEEAPVLGPVKHAKGMVVISGSNTPVVMFTTQVASDSGAWRSVQIGIRKEFVDDRQAAAKEALLAMFRVSALTTVLSFGLTLGLLAWMLRRDVRRQRKSADEEHLTFAGVMADGIVHDLRNPMSSLRLDVQMIGREIAKGDDLREDRVQELTERARTTLDRMDAVFGEFLYMSKPGGADPQDVDLRSLLTDCVDLLRAHFEREEITLSLELPAMPMPVRLRPVETKRALVNILTNARQVSSSGDKVEVHLAEVTGRAVIDILDEGPGLPKGDPEKIFKMFESGRPGGTGIGLALARTAIESNDGRIHALDRTPKGARFQISFNLRRDG